MKSVIRTKISLAAIGLSVILLNGCTTANPYTGANQMNDTSKGVGLGALGGAAIGAILDGGQGALIGGAIGALTGGVIGHSFDQENEELRRTLMGTGVQVQQVGNTIQLVMAADVTFDTNQAAIRSNFYPTLNSVAIVLKKYDDNNIAVSGYTDSVGGDAYNQVLSEQRAKSVADYLISQGISPRRFFTRGLGKRNPIASNNSAQGRALNRRVVLTLSQKA